MWSKEDLKQFQVLGSSLQSIMGGFGSFTMLASKFLLEEGLGTPDDTMIAQLEPNKWYPLDSWVRVFDRIHAEFGSFTLRQVGMHVPKNAMYPPQITDVVSAVKMTDIGYHLNHGINGVPMFNPQTGEMKEGIGHYRAIHTPGQPKISIQVDSPYPCPFDEGLLLALSQRFNPKATITHDKATCRSRNDAMCTYHIAWK
ncbi:MAG TPA: hypothetical protein VF815_32290 [Myxococcaceae bacterium]|jgi:hypothetical protein